MAFFKILGATGTLCIVLCLSLPQRITTFTLQEETQEKKSYTGYKLLATSALADEHMESALTEEVEGKEGVQLWNSPKSQQGVNILVAPEKYANLKEFLARLGTKHEVVIEDIQAHIDEEFKASPALAHGRQASHGMDWESFHRYQGKTPLGVSTKSSQEVLFHC